MKYDHIGIPTTAEKTWCKYLEDCKVHISDPEKDEFRVEWLKFEAGSPMHPLIQQGPHLAFIVENLDCALSGKNVIVPPFDAAPGVRCAFIDHDGFAVELMEKSACAVGGGCGCG